MVFIFCGVYYDEVCDVVLCYDEWVGVVGEFLCDLCGVWFEVVDGFDLCDWYLSFFWWDVMKVFDFD